MAQAMIDLNASRVVTHSSDFFNSTDEALPTPTNSVLSEYNSMLTGLKKARRQGRRLKLATTGKAANSSRSKSAGQETKNRSSSRSDGSSASKKEREKKEVLTPITAFFPVRRSDRRGMSAAEVKKARETDIVEKIKAGCEDGLEVMTITDKGRGVVATKEFSKDDFVVEYAGELVNITTAKQREGLYAKDEEVGCYMYYFVHKNKHYCIDATAETGKLGRLLNHSRKGNCYTKVIPIGDRPYLVLLASQRIEKGQELTYDYGDRSPTALKFHPWLKL
ncbi:hypothetical protein ACOMHN_063114 [Nucella lapillus]